MSKPAAAARGQERGDPPVLLLIKSRSASKRFLSLVYLRGLLFLMERFVHVLLWSGAAGLGGVCA